mgnify:CR=1 FL=1
MTAAKASGMGRLSSIGMGSNSTTISLHRQDAKSAKKETHRARHRLLTIRLMPSLMSRTFQLTRKPILQPESFR